MASRAQPVLYVDELILRPWAAADVPALSAAYADPAIRHWHTRSMTRSEASQWVSAANGGWASETAANWAVTARDGLVGRMSLRTVDLEDGLAEIGYWVVPAARGRGIAPRALVSVSN
jgi:[ribosomal protein S5]-alanine N-acetyltransferase